MVRIRRQSVAFQVFIELLHFIEDKAFIIEFEGLLDLTDLSDSDRVAGVGKQEQFGLNLDHRHYPGIEAVVFEELVVLLLLLILRQVPFFHEKCVGKAVRCKVVVSQEKRTFSAH